MLQISYEKLSTIIKQSPRNIQQVAKQISQVIAKSWLPEGEEIRSILLSYDNDIDKTDRIWEMLENNGVDVGVFGDLENIKIEVSWDTFTGKFIDEGGGSSPNFTLVIAYPPKPSEFDLLNSDLEAWVQNKDEEQLVPNHPYIPVTY